MSFTSAQLDFLIPELQRDISIVTENLKQLCVLESF
jgi:hypothetical protein